MARREARFTCRVKLDHDFTLIPHLSQAGYHLQIRKFLIDDNGNVQEDQEEEFQEKFFLLDFVFGSNRHRRHVAQRLREAGWRQRSLERILDEAFSEAKLILQREKNRRDFRSIPTIRFCVNKFVRWEDELEGMALELSLQEAPRPLPATKESIQALKKVKVEGDIAQECMICMEQLSSGTEVTSMPCSHLFHGDCIQEWLNTSHKCPLCRFPMPTDG
ncbi:E3 ubiquitin-protein ligase CIP8-like [Herrania umbratica]|uniref:RING-type E3 ubiquitin transferase n=1 Tax=Herrania umbratica TaxID=108875 RepID=A0A6J1BHN5_9ROSI|nr:E3 ubiquitin-protein ligase CIP8-like [Herrania umbratica]